MMTGWRARTKCPSCGGSNVKIGSTIYEDADYEQSECLDCGASWGGATFWE